MTAATRALCSTCFKGINPNYNLDFDVDFSNLRLKQSEKSEDIRKFIYVKVFFETPPSYRASLGKEFWVKRQWTDFRTNNFNQEVSSEHRKSNRYTSITRILNRIKFTYIPAVKDRQIFSNLLNDVYKILVEDEGFGASLSTFSSDIQKRTEALSGSLSSLFKFDSVIAAPTDLSNLFKSLDFETGKENDNSKYSLILQRGDGIQARHIPEILKFISENDSNKFHIWGFEEPENSLEHSAASKEAARFLVASKSNVIQSFLTSHSPSFYSLSGGGVAKYFVKQVSDIEEKSISKIGEKSEEIDSLRLMGDDFYLPIISKVVDRVEKERFHLKEERELLLERLRLIEKPIFFVEGEGDAKILSAAWSSLTKDVCPFKFEPSLGTPKMKALAAEGLTLEALGNNRKVFALVDYDGAGRTVMPKKVSGTGWRKHVNGVFWRHLAPPDELIAALDKAGLQQDYTSCVLEDMFPASLRLEAQNLGFYSLGELRPDYSRPECKIMSAISTMDSDPETGVYQLRPESKDEFSDWVEKRMKEQPDLAQPFADLLFEARACL
ncbi:hypothetical protein [Pyruvatibacter sp.]|uniref:hypothetical protein n=1 Tax=Pyruvatibacter sp. TaxID=1981328 RepID=UPI0032EB7B7F